MDWNGARALVTGGAGFVPSHIVDALVAEGAVVTVLDNMQAGRMENLAEVTDRITFLQEDVRDAESVRSAVEGQDFVFHLAANASVPGSVRDPRYDLESNALGTLNVMEAAKESGVRRVVYASSAAVYGPPESVPTDESHRLRPTSFYGLSKLYGEQLGFMYHRLFGVSFSAVRIFNTYGPRQPRYVLADLVRKLMKNPHELEVLGTGEQVRDYAFATDTAGAFLTVAADEDLNGKACNVSGGQAISIRDLVSIILEVMDLPDCRVRYTGESWKGDIDHLEADISRIGKAGYAPSTLLADGIRRTIDSGTIVGESEF
ncbi:MAG: NAD-dependent epimerase/dehydratase family protein [Gemmatimonadota bacterium]|jgi:UDP-glucose 4-epimerase|nr:NAD-dependent epimerase/dehydratase family protein [Gemmatimonadota bacterium]MDP7031193.1 NAD-dependent epimerase/dehydratase family protein [Gemmatimonadota bacterium]